MFLASKCSTNGSFAHVAITQSSIAISMLGFASWNGECVQPYADMHQATAQTSRSESPPEYPFAAIMQFLFRHGRLFVPAVTLR